MAVAVAVVAIIETIVPLSIAESPVQQAMDAATPELARVLPAAAAPSVTVVGRIVRTKGDLEAIVPISTARTSDPAVERAEDGEPGLSTLKPVATSLVLPVPWMAPFG